MKLSEILFNSAKETWDISLEKPFVLAMAKGTLEETLYINYTKQDYLYLMEYIDVLKRIKSLAENDEMISFLTGLIEGILMELEMVHLPNLRKYGVSDEEIKESKLITAMSDYLGFMKSCIDDYGLLGGLTGLLQCSWLYAYIGEKVVEKYAEEVSNSKYKSWFDAYTSQDYITANQNWIDVVDTYYSDLDNEKLEVVCNIFKNCAMYENKLWDALYN